MPNENENTWSDSEKRIYNTYYREARLQANKPFRSRKNFEKLDGTTHLACKRLSSLFQRYPDIDIELYFKAPYKIYTDTKWFSLTFFASLGALRAYTQYKNLLASEDPDQCADKTLSSLQFIATHCIEHKTPLYRYHSLTTQTDVPDWALHLKQGKINRYSLMEFKDILASAHGIDPDVVRMYVGDFIDVYPSLRLSYLRSEKLLPLVRKAFDLFSQKVLTKIQNHPK